MKQVLKVMEDMVELEITLADLYHACSQEFSDNTQFWYAMKRQEERHADSIRRMSALIAAKSQEFTPGRSFNASAFKTIRKGVLAHLAALKRGEIEQARMMSIARDIEASVLQANYRGLVNTANVQYMAAISRIEDETLAHKNLMVSKIALTKG